MAQRYKKSPIPLRYGGLFCVLLGDSQTGRMLLLEVTLNDFFDEILRVNLVGRGVTFNKIIAALKQT
jgi:hypothetical protein